MHFHIEGLPPYDGDHPIDLTTFTNRELHIIKEMTGVRANEFDEAFEAGDNDLIVAFCAIALRRANLEVNNDRLWDASVGKIQLVVGEEDEDPQTPESEGSGTDTPELSGDPSEAAGENQANGQSPTGNQDSDTGSGSDPPTSAS